MMQQDHLIRVLGPIDVLTPSGAMAVGGRQVRALLGALVVGVGHSVSVDHLEEVLWDDDPPHSADNTLQSYVSHLRQILGADAVIRVDHSYELIASPDNVDALRFGSLLSEALAIKDDAARRRQVGREALALWRGPAFGDLADDEAFKLEAYRLDEMRIAAMELCLAADLALGNHDLIVGELEAAVEEHPYRERLWFLLIETLAGSGRRVEALRACARLRRVLSSVGVQAGDELTTLEQQILEGHPFNPT